MCLTSRRPKPYVDAFKSEPTGHWGTAPRWALGKYEMTGPCRPPDWRERRPEQSTGIFRARSCDILTTPALHLPSPTYGMIACRRRVRFDGVWHPVSWGFQRVYLEGGSDAHSGFVDFDDCDGFDGGTRSGPDVRSGLSGLPACLPAVGGSLLRLQLHVAASVQRVGIGPRRHVRHQSIFCWCGRAPRGLSAASPRLLKRMII